MCLVNFVHISLIIIIMIILLLLFFSIERQNESSLMIENAKNMHIVLNVFFCVDHFCQSQQKKERKSNHQIQIKIRNKSIKILNIYCNNATVFS